MSAFRCLSFSAKLRELSRDGTTLRKGKCQVRAPKQMLVRAPGDASRVRVCDRAAWVRGCVHVSQEDVKIPVPKC